jgi:cell surface protein SprA
MAGAIEPVPGTPAPGPEWSTQPAGGDQDPEPEPLDPQRINPPSSELPDHQKRNTSPVRVQDPDNIEFSSEYDPETGLVTIYRKIGNIPVKLPYTMTLEEYNNEAMRSSMQDYWSEKVREGSGEEGDGFGRFRVGGDMFESVFGSNAINIRPQGIAELRIGVNTTKIDNPTLQERMRKTTTFDFQQKIQMNIQGTIGERLKLGINYNTEATFDFENQINLEYAGGEDDIIKKIEAGNVTMSLPGTLITGSQSLFGVKTEMQFGKLSVQTVFSQQKGETSVMNIQGGAQTQDFDLAADAYDKNRHFFLSHVFKKNFDRAMENLPVVSSPFNITKVEVWITNRSGDFESSRNIVAFSDLGEGMSDMEKPNTWQGQPNVIYPHNKANELYNQMTTTYSGIRDINQSTTILNGISAGADPNTEFTTARDYERIENARLIPESEYTLNTKLGYISLNAQLNADEVLAVAFEYTYNGQVFRVGEFSNAGIEAPQALIMKLIKGTKLSPRMKTWQLMMKNVYAIGAYQVSEDDFRLNVVYMNDSLGSYMNTFTEQGTLNGQQYISIMELDKLNSQQEPYPDGTFDYVPGYTIIPAQGRIIFPVLEPFGAHMETQLQNYPQSIREKYIFKELYDSTLTIASQTAEKNKYRLQGSYKSSGGAEISLNAFNIPRGSVVVTAGGLRLTENVDYSVDYTSGRIRILNSGLLESGTPIQVSLESQSLFNLQTKTLIGTHLDYRFSENFNIGGTIMHLRERPLTQKVNFGDEPIANTIWGLNTSYYTESNLITSLLDKLPLIETKTPSSVAFEAEFAQLIPGHPNVIDKAGTSYIDDFEGTKIPIDMKQRDAWNLASTPQGQEGMFPNANTINELEYGFERARLAWYNIDPLFTRNSNLRPDHIRRDEDQLSNHYVREIYEREIFPFKNPAYGEPTNISVLNLAYYPKERGPYNFNTNLNFEGELPNPKESWGGIMRKIDTNDFESANIDHIEFWVMDPFIYNQDTHEGGNLYINLGDISEDILRDSRKFFEQGLPGPGEPFDVDSTVWGYIPKQQSLVTAFSNDAATRLMQDVGLNGMNSERERAFLRKETNSFLSVIDNMYANGQISEAAHTRIVNDPAADDFQYFRGSELDQNEVSILDRYKFYNNPEGNSRPSDNSGESFSTAATNIPDGEDINRDNTLSEAENYFQFEVPLRPGEMEIGQNYITDIVTARDVDLENGTKADVRWYQFKIPVNTPDTIVGNMDDLRSVRFMRMFLHEFADTVILRFASLDLIRSEWRRYERQLYDTIDNRNNVVPNPNTQFEVSAVNIEENGNREPVNYVLPPGIDRVIDPANPSVRELNEQSISLKVENLARGDARAVYKNIGMDIRQYKRLKMDIHAEAVPGHDLQDGQMVAFIRLGTDYQGNYYEYELPLKLTPHGNYLDNNTAHRYAVWPEENSMNIPLELFQQIKLKRNDAMRMANASVRMTDEYPMTDPENPDNIIRIKGNPNLSNVKTIMIGVRNTSIDDKTAEIWMNELRLSDFNEQGGWAANSRLNIKLADLGSVSVAGRASTIGFGSIDQSVTERSQENFYQYDVATNLELGKLLGPESRLSIPFYAGISEQVATPEYYPLDPDIPLDVALKNAETKAERDSIKNVSQDYTKRKSINFTNVRIQPKDNESPFYAPSNLSATYSYNETYRRNIDTEYLTDKNYRGILAYNFINRPKPVEPFKNLKGSALGLIRDFNFYWAPTQIGYRWEVMRGYREEQLRNISNPNFQIPLNINKDFYWNRHFDLTFNLTRSLKFDFRSTNNAVIDEPEGPVNKNRYKDEYDLWKDSVMTSIANLGRTTNYQHNVSLTYNIPINKLPYLDWTSASVNYGALYNWQQGPITRLDYNWGNVIRNSNTIQGNAQLNFNNLYNKSTYLRELNRPPQRQQQQRTATQGGETVRFTQHNLEMKAGEPYTVSHRLETSTVTARVFNESGHPVRGDQNVVDKNTLTFTPQQDVTNARVMVTGQKTEEPNTGKALKDFSLRLLTSLRSVSLTYSENNGTILPGYLPETQFMGSENFNGLQAPGIPFIMGWQSRDFALRAAENNWLTTDSTLNSAYSMSHTQDITLRVMLEPISGLKIDLTSNRRYANNLSEYYLYQNGDFDVFNTMESGSFSMTFNAIGTAFNKVGKKGVYQSDTFDQFMTNRQTIANRLGSERRGMTHPNGIYTDTPYEPVEGLPYQPGGYPNEDLGVEEGVDGYSLTAQDVMIPAFLAAYSGKDADGIFLEAIPSILQMQPNWRVTYDGLSRIKWFQKYIRSFDLSHAYRSTYNVGQYLTNLDWEEMRDGFSFMRDEQGNFIPKYQINGVSISEQFAPFIQFNITWNNSLSTRAEYKKSRIINLSLNNNQLIENYNDEYVVGLGYRFDKMNMILGSGRGQKQMSSDLNLRADISIRDNFSIIRRIEEGLNQMTAGQRITTLKFTADYVLSDRFNMQLFYDRQFNAPYISTSYPITNSSFGVNFRFSLAQ